MREIGYVFLSLPDKQKRKMYSDWVQGKAVTPTWFFKIIEEIMDEYTLDETGAIYMFAQMTYFNLSMKKAYEELLAYESYTLPFWFKTKNDY